MNQSRTEFPEVRDSKKRERLNAVPPVKHTYSSNFATEENQNSGEQWPQLDIKIHKRYWKDTVEL